MKTIVLKFGGSSLDVNGYNIIKNRLLNINNQKIIIVLSAIQKTTNNLIELTNGNLNIFDIIKNEHKKLLKDLNLNENILEDDFNKILEFTKLKKNKIINNINIISYGEILSTIILFEYLKLFNINSDLINAKEIIKCDINFEEINLNNLKMKGKFSCSLTKLNCYKSNIIITQGFIASTKDNYSCLLTRGGSDTTASLIASSIKAEYLEIWSDVNGLYTTDPKLVDNTKLIKNINYSLCQEVAAMGAKILHPYCIDPCKKYNIPIIIKNTKDPNNTNSTLINNNLNNKDVFIITKQSNIYLIEIKSLNMWNNYGILNDIFSKFTQFKIDVDIIVTSPFSISCTINSIDNINNLISSLYNYSVIFKNNIDIVSIVSNNIFNINVSNIINAYNSNIHIVHYSSNKYSLSYVINNNKSKEFINALHNKLNS
mgnify:CR=1 FL=1|tara:strand:+ start:1056 stop:2342 length:1287 start_codon:yes stop_codon:yes gene_type:complete